MQLELQMFNDDKVSLFYGEDNPAAVDCCVDGDSDDLDKEFLVNPKTRRRATLFSKVPDPTQMTTSAHRSVFSAGRPLRHVSERRSATMRPYSPEGQNRYRRPFFCPASISSVDPSERDMKTSEFSDMVSLNTLTTSTKTNRKFFDLPSLKYTKLFKYPT